MACLTLLGAAPGVARAQSSLQLGEPAPPPTLDLGAQRPAPGTPGTPAAPAAPTAPRASAPAVPLPGPTAGGQEVSRTQKGDWEVACADNGECAMAQIGEDGEGTPILEMVVRKLPQPLTVGDRTAIAVLDIVTPLGVVLTDGLGLSIDGAAPETAPFQICTEQGCLVREPIDEQLVQRFKRGSNAKVQVVAASQGEVAATLSLRGFTAAFDGL